MKIVYDDDREDVIIGNPRAKLNIAKKAKVIKNDEKKINKQFKKPKTTNKK
tara:strand:+ start:491 stop:643 length:153 start_codon:yes stop_codon:yes gene_type:complete